MFEETINNIDSILKSLYPKSSNRDYPQKQKYFIPDRERKHAARLMRVDHVGEICAQALYTAQIMTATDQSLKETLEHAKEEELDHLMWCNRALVRLNSTPSFLVGLWAFGSFMLALQMSVAGNDQNAAFLEETEKQVGLHIEGHLKELPWYDIESTKILERMYVEEIGHQHTAQSYTESRLNPLLATIMRYQSKFMTYVALYI